MSNNRKRKLIRHDLQLKVVFISLFVASLVLLINFQLSLAALWSLSGKLTSTTDVTVAFEQLRQSVISRFLVSVGMAIPLSAAIGILYSFKFSGPIYRFKQYFGAMAQGGRWDQRCRLRENDDLKDVCEAINEALDDVRNFMAENRELLQELQTLHARGAVQAGEEARAALNRLMNRVAVVNATYQERLAVWPPANDDADTAAGESRAASRAPAARGDASQAADEASALDACDVEADEEANEKEKHLETQV